MGRGGEGGQLQRERDNKPTVANLAQMTKVRGGGGWVLQFAVSK